MGCQGDSRISHYLQFYNIHTKMDYPYAGRIQPTTLSAIWAAAACDIEAVILARAYYRCGLLQQDNVWMHLPAFASMATLSKSSLLEYQSAVIHQTPLQFPVDYIESPGWTTATTAYMLIALLCVGVLTDGPEYGEQAPTASSGVYKTMVERAIAQGRVNGPLLEAFRSVCIRYLATSRVSSVEAWTWVRRHRLNWRGWSRLLDLPFRTIAREGALPNYDPETIENPITRLYFSELRFYDVLPTVEWSQLIGPTLPGNTNGPIDLRHIWAAAVDYPNALLLARAYYRTGQLPVTEWPIVLLVRRWDGETVESPLTIRDLTLNRLLMSPNDNLSLEMRVLMQDITATVQLAVSTLNPEQLMLYRLFMFVTVFVRVIKRLMPGHHRSFLREDLLVLISHISRHLNTNFPAASLETRTAQWATAWRHVLTRRQDCIIEAYSFYYKSSLSMKPAYLLRTISLSKVLLEGKWEQYPIMKCYRELLVNAISSYEAGLTELVPRSATCPELYVPVKVGVSPTIKALDIGQLTDLSGLISSYASAPTFDQVLDRLAQL